MRILFERVFSERQFLMSVLINFMCENPLSQAVLVAGRVNTRSNKLHMNVSTKFPEGKKNSQNFH